MTKHNRPFGIKNTDEFVKFVNRPKHTNLTNEITGSYHTERKTDPVLVAVGIIITVCGIIYLVSF